MRYLLAFVAPPFALLVCRKWVQFVINLIFWLLSIPLIFVMGIGFLIWFMCTAHALVVCIMKRADKRFDRLITAIESRTTSTPSTAKS